MIDGGGVFQGGGGVNQSSERGYPVDYHLFGIHLSLHVAMNGITESSV